MIDGESYHGVTAEKLRELLQKLDNASEENHGTA
jgi:NADH:ubiquinone oxidoreductase subunit E